MDVLNSGNNRQFKCIGIMTDNRDADPGGGDSDVGGGGGQATCLRGREKRVERLG